MAMLFRSSHCQLGLKLRIGHTVRILSWYVLESDFLFHCNPRVAVVLSPCAAEGFPTPQAGEAHCHERDIDALLLVGSQLIPVERNLWGAQFFYIDVW